MYTIKIDVNDTIYDKVMFFLQNIPVSNLEVKKSDKNAPSKEDNIVNFFHNSPLSDNVRIEREREIYEDSVSL